MKLRRGAIEVWLLAVVGALVSTFCSSGALAQDITYAAFTYVDCGATTSHEDSQRDIYWRSDTGSIGYPSKIPFISTGTATNVTLNSANASSHEFATLRYFSSDLQKSCYTLAVIKNSTYYLRLSFYHGKYDGSSFASFNVGVDATILTEVTIADPTIVYYWEYVIQPQRNVTFVCLMPNRANSNPFISSIALRETSKSILPPRLKPLLANNETIYNAWRLNLGSGTDTVRYTLRYPEDLFDRLWVPMTKSSPLITATSPLEYDYGAYVREGVIPQTHVPLAVLRTAITTSGNMSIFLPPPDGANVLSAQLVLYFAELDDSCNKTDRQFHIHVPDPYYSDRYMNPRDFVYGSTGLWSDGSYWDWNHMIYTTFFSVLLYPNVTRTSLRGPILNALELSYSLGKNALPTNVADMTAIEVIKGEMNLANWSGDPCLPYPHPWLSCANTSTGEFEIRAVILSGYHLNGPISNAFGDLTHLRMLVLDDNRLKGNFPDLRRLINLEKLHVQNNLLSGTVPAWLFSLPSLKQLYIQNNNFSGPLPENSNLIPDFRYEGLRPSSPTGSRKKFAEGGSIGGVAAAVILIGILVFIWRYWIRSAKKSPTDDSSIMDKTPALTTNTLQCPGHSSSVDKTPALT